MAEVETEKYKSLYFCVSSSLCTHDRCDGCTKRGFYQWYAIDFPSTNRWKIRKLTSTIQNMPRSFTHSTTILPFDHRIYLLGGQDNPKVFCFDTNHPHNGWKECQHMIIGHEKPSASVFDGKIFVLESKNDDNIFPQSEVFDPMLNKWEPLRQPRDFGTQNPRATDVDSWKRIQVHKTQDWRGNGSTKIYSYNVKSKYWTYFRQNYSNLCLTDAAVVYDGVLYWYSERLEIYGYDLVNGILLSNPVMGLGKKNVFPPRNDKSPAPVWLVHLGGGKLCLAWYGLAPWLVINMTVHCTTFRVDKCENEAGEVNLVATIESCAVIKLNGSQCLDFIAL